MNQEKPEQGAPPKRDRRSRSLGRRIGGVMVKHAILAGAAFICAGLFILMLMDTVVMPFLLKSGTETVTPDLLGVPLEQAEQLTDDLGLRLLPTSSEYNGAYPANTVSFQYPYPGTNVKPGRRVQVRVSLGARPVEMPNVVGRSRRDAELILNPYGLTIDRFEWVHSDEYVRGIVARQEPEGNQKIPENALVVLYISDGLPETNVVMPRLVDLGLSAALDTLRAYRFDMDSVRTHIERAPHLLPETVIDQHPDPGSPTSTETIVDLIISTSGEETSEP